MFCDRAALEAKRSMGSFSDELSYFILKELARKNGFVLHFLFFGFTLNPASTRIRLPGGATGDVLNSDIQYSLDSNDTAGDDGASRQKAQMTESLPVREIRSLAISSLPRFEKKHY